MLVSVHPNHMDICYTAESWAPHLGDSVDNGPLITFGEPLPKISKPNLGYKQKESGVG